MEELNYKKLYEQTRLELQRAYKELNNYKSHRTYRVWRLNKVDLRREFKTEDFDEDTVTIDSFHSDSITKEQIDYAHQIIYIKKDGSAITVKDRNPPLHCTIVTIEDPNGSEVTRWYFDMYVKIGDIIKTGDTIFEVTKIEAGWRQGIVNTKGQWYKYVTVKIKGKVEKKEFKPPTNFKTYPHPGLSGW